MSRAFGYLSQWWRSFASPSPASSTAPATTDLSRRGFLGGLSAVAVAPLFLHPLLPTTQTEAIRLVFKARPSTLQDILNPRVFYTIEQYLAPPLGCMIDFHPRENYRQRHA